MDMAWIRWNLLFSIGLFVSPAFVSMDQSGFRRYYVLQPGPSGSDRVHVSSISSRSGAAGQPQTYNVELTASFAGGQVRTRRMGNQATQSIPLRQDSQQQFTQQQIVRHTSHQVKVSGVNVCGGQCCHGWSQAPGSQRCTKPHCLPQCQNGGMCLRPQLCICKPGSKGKACEQKAVPGPSNPTLPGTGHTNGHTNGHTVGQGGNGHGNGHTNGQTVIQSGNGHPNGGRTTIHTVVPQRPIPQQAYPPQPHGPAVVPGGANVAQMTVTMKRPQPYQTHVRSPVSVTMQRGQSHSQQFIMKPKYYHTTHTQVHRVGPPPDRAIPLSVGHGHGTVHVPSAGNQTGRIKVVFTPTICKVTCMGGRCQNSCEKGNTTTIISENGYATDTLTVSNFRVVVCHLPCINGGKCSARDKCQCPPNFTGKFCQMPVQSGNHRQQQSQASQIHSTHTLPLTYNNGQKPVQFPPNFVNIHVKHPPEASVQIHQVSQLDANGQKVKGSQSSSTSTHRHTYQHSESSSSSSHSSSSSSHKVQQQGHAGVVYPNQQTYIHYQQPVTSKSQLGRCFQETTGAQCGKAFPGLVKQDDCCGTVGTSWGFHKCQKCPKKPSLPQTDTRYQSECPQGYKKVNNSCQDVDECQQVQGLCPNGDCMNTQGSYRCICRAGFKPDATLSGCIPLFKEICPGGMGYHVTGQIKPKPFNRPQQPQPQPQPQPYPQPQPRPRPPYQEPVLPPVPLPTSHKPVEALSVTERQLPSVPVVTVAPEQELVFTDAGSSSVVDPGQPQLSPGISTIRIEPPIQEVVEKTSPPEFFEIRPSSASQGIAPTQSSEVNECQVSPDICGHGICYNTPKGYTCHCYEGYQLNEEQTTCVDVDECGERPLLCANGHCRNTAGSFQCACQHGFQTGDEGTSCVDVDECLRPDACRDDDLCVNTPGSFLCRRCDRGFRMNPNGQCEDIDECLDRSNCPSGLCYNKPGSFDCDPCPPGFEGKDGQCVDIDECLDTSACEHGRCSNFEGYFVCSCDDGYGLSPDGKSCTDLDECQDDHVCTRGHCQNTEGSFMCVCEAGFRLSGAGDQCDDVDECRELPEVCGGVGVCVNNLGSYLCSCSEGYQQVSGTSCQDVNECVDDPELCGANGECLNVEGSFQCVCDMGFTLNQGTNTCEDVDECVQSIRCEGGTCVNTRGSYTCECDLGFRLQADNHTCQDIDECAELSPGICGAWRCENTLGSFTCVVSCPPGHTRDPQGVCVDIDECSQNETLCGSPDFCENLPGSYRCHCDRGFEETPDGRGCVDLNECELLATVCGEARCENVEGSFMCTCPDENQEYDQMTATCVTPTGSVERKECYYNLNDENLCDNVLTTSVTIQECCCTLGAGWGDNCEVHPCPIPGTDQFAKMCPAGKGKVPSGDDVFGVASVDSFKDADECALFGSEICKGGFCLNQERTYECYCKAGLFYDDVKLECIDTDECLDESNCVGGECMNTQGSYNCFCPPPMMLMEKRCVYTPPVAETREHQIFQDVCWQTVTAMICNDVLPNKRTTYAECCCLYGEAWGMDCALCPEKDSEDYATMCNVPFSGSRSRPYGRDALVAGPVQEYEVGVDYQPSPDYLPRPQIPEQTQGSHTLPLYEDEDPPYDAFEGLRAEECGILNGCENGRCVRVQEGYTCDCFDGYTLDMSRMACVDVNECSELNSRMSLCKNAKCINTQGSYKCQCLPGFVHSERPNYCVPKGQAPAAANDSRE
ncbi:latent-transforming growth factor beta-binding protein 1 isoform X2 [Sardina pilchardus]|uniref:latent-transforming growth factor beta-binding protein 1 isoform X2 n=1 Tax=Sardina pilchardus TaxID=27697 RepID=UPI002E0EC413